MAAKRSVLAWPAAMFLALAIGGALDAPPPEVVAAPQEPPPPSDDPESPPPEPADGGAAQLPEETARLEKLRAEIEDLRSRLVRGESEAGTLLDQLDEIDLNLAVFTREAQVLKVEIEATRRAERKARLEAEAAARRTALAERELRSWLVELYKAGPARDLSLILSTSSPAALASAERAAEALAREQARRVETLRASRARMETAARELQAQSARLERLSADLARRQEGYQEARRSKDSLLSGIRARQKSGEEALGAMVQSERDLQALLGTLQGSPGGGSVPSYGLTRFRGLLNWPVLGPIAIPFGNVRHPRFGTQVPHPGLEISCQPGETVRSLFDGRVAFSDWFRGYGQMIVIEHGDEYLSIYGQLGERLVEAGTVVHRDEPIARSGEEGTFGVTGLYLEIRHGGRAEDPRPWLKRDAGPNAVHREMKR